MVAGAGITAAGVMATTGAGVGARATTVGIAGDMSPLRWAETLCPPDLLYLVRFYLVLPNLPLPEDLRTFVFFCATVSEEPAKHLRILEQR
jgi:hypothetical protein